MKNKRYKNIAYVFLLPWLIGLVGFTLFPMIYSLYLSFTDYSIFGKPNFIGIKNYISMFTMDTHYVNSLKVTMIYVFTGVPLQLLISLLLANILTKSIKGVSIFRGLFYIPSLLGSSVAVSVLWRQIFSSGGLINNLLNNIGIESNISWISNPNYAIWTLVILWAWQFGSPMIIFIAGLKQIPKSLYESAEIDGAKKRQQFFKITLPMLSPIILFNMIMQIISAFKAFTPAFIISSGTGGVLDCLRFYTLGLYREAFVNLRMGYASAMAWILLVIIAFFTIMQFRLSKKWVYTEE